MFGFPVEPSPPIKLPAPQPIETAPREEDRRLLLWCPEQGGWHTGEWCDGRWLDSLTLTEEPLMMVAAWLLLAAVMWIWKHGRAAWLSATPSAIRSPSIVVSRRPAHMALPPRQQVLDPIPLIVARMSVVQ
jgi:hypothetical protein